MAYVPEGAMPTSSQPLESARCALANGGLRICLVPHVLTRHGLQPLQPRVSTIYNYCRPVHKISWLAHQLSSPRIHPKLPIELRANYSALASQLFSPRAHARQLCIVSRKLTIFALASQLFCTRTRPPTLHRFACTCTCLPSCVPVNYPSPRALTILPELANSFALVCLPSFQRLTR